MAHTKAIDRETGAPLPLTVWWHIGTGTFYLVLDVAICATNGPRNMFERSVVYRSMADGGLFYRELSEFLDGRFEPADIYQDDPYGRMDG